MSDTVLQARLRRAWTQRALADFAQVSLSSIQRAECGEALRVDICQRICQCLGKERPGELGLRCCGEQENEEALPQYVESRDPAGKGDEKESEEHMDASKRDTLRKIGNTVTGIALATFPSFSLMQMGSGLHDEEVLALCQIYVPIWWRLYYEGHHQEIRKVLPGHLLQLSPLVERSSRYQQRAANIASQAHQLAYQLAIQQQDFCTALMHTKQAFQYGVIAEDANSQTSALIRQGYVYYLANDPESMLDTYQRAFQYREKVSPLVQGRTYIGLANAYAFLKQKQDALHFLGLAHDTFPEHPEQDPAYVYTHWSRFTFATQEVITYLQLHQPADAWKACEKTARLGTLRTAHIAELLTRQAETSLALGEMDQCCSYVALATTSALELGSDLRHKEAHSVYQQMLLKWPQERQVKELAVHFQ